MWVGLSAEMPGRHAAIASTHRRRVRPRHLTFGSRLRLRRGGRLASHPPRDESLAGPRSAPIVAPRPRRRGRAAGGLRGTPRSRRSAESACSSTTSGSPGVRTTRRSSPAIASTPRRAARSAWPGVHELDGARQLVECPLEPDPLGRPERSRVLRSEHHDPVELPIGAEVGLHGRHPVEHPGVVLGSQRLGVLTDLVGQVDQRDHHEEPADELPELGQRIQVQRSLGSVKK